MEIDMDKVNELVPPPVFAEDVPKTKDDIIVEQCKESGEPYMVFRAKDDIALGLVEFYLMRGIEEKLSPDFLEKVKVRFKEFIDWRDENPELVRLPD